MSGYDPFFGGKSSGFLAYYQTTQQICNNYSKKTVQAIACTTEAVWGVGLPYLGGRVVIAFARWLS